MKKLTFLCGVIIFMMTCSTAFAAKAFEINFTTPYFDRHPTVVNVFKPWAKEMERLSKGRLEITYFAPNTICPEGEILDSAAIGIIEMGGNAFSRNLGRLAMAEMAQIPMASRSPRAFAMAWWEVCQKYPEFFPEFQQDIKLLFVWGTAQTQLHTTKKPIRTMEDMKGMKLIGWTPTTMEYIKMLGGTPMFQSSADSYLALERGMAEGALCPLAPLRSQKLTDILKYHTVADISITPFWGGINRKFFDAMPPDLQKLIVDSTGLEFSGKIGQSLDDGAAEDLAWIKKQGKAEVITLDDAERARWAEAFAPLKEAAIKKVVAAGFTEQQAKEVHNYFLERIAYHTEHSPK